MIKPIHSYRHIYMRNNNNNQMPMVQYHHHQQQIQRGENWQKREEII